jgi:hypothetical protein
MMNHHTRHLGGFLSPICHDLGIGCCVDLAEAADLFKMEADQGNAHGLFNFRFLLSELARSEVMANCILEFVCLAGKESSRTRPWGLNISGDQQIRGMRLAKSMWDSVITKASAWPEIRSDQWNTAKQQQIKRMLSANSTLACAVFMANVLQLISSRPVITSNSELTEVTCWLSVLSGTAL